MSHVFLVFLNCVTDRKILSGHFNDAVLFLNPVTSLSVECTCSPSRTGFRIPYIKRKKETKINNNPITCPLFRVRQITDKLGQNSIHILIANIKLYKKLQNGPRCKFL